MFWTKALRRELQDNEEWVGFGKYVSMHVYCSMLDVQGWGRA